MPGTALDPGHGTCVMKWPIARYTVGGLSEMGVQVPSLVWRHQAVLPRNGEMSVKKN